VDIGGGSTDIALMVRTEWQEAFVVVDSIRYAGDALVTALSRGQCLRAGLSEAGFRRWIRETGDLRALQRMRTIFDSRREPAMMHKTQYFYGYLREYLARILAAHIVTGEWQGLSRRGKEIRRGEKEIEIIRQEGYYIALYPLGNGWGFGSLLHLYADRFADQLQQRTEAILREVLGDMRNDFPEIRVVAQTLRTHPKAAVAQGMLMRSTSDETRRIDLLEQVPLRTILGWTVQVGRTRRIPWHRETDATGFPPQGEVDIQHGSILDCPPDEPPRFPSDLDGPYDIDPELKQTRQTLNRECLRGRDWFIRTPLQVFMESLFKPHLERVV
jgi:hypothetical protein